MYATFGAAALDGKAVGALRPAAVVAGVGADYTWFFVRHWGIGAGVEAAFPNAQLSSGEIDRSPQGSPANLHRNVTRLYATYLRVPLWLRFRAPVWRHWLHIAAGAALDLALDGRYRTETTVRTGNSTQTAATTGMLSFGHGASLIAETGLRWTLDSEWGIYTGAYAAYGMSDVRPTGNDALRDVERLNLLQVGVKVKIVISE
jgi:hypothetical protein